MKCSTDVRVAALEALVEVVKADSRMADWEFLLEIIEHDPEPRVRHELLTLLASNPPFERGRGSRLDTIPVMERLWKQMKYIYLDICALFNWKNNRFNLPCSVELSHDAMLRNDIVDLYNCLYGRRKPPCLSGAMYQRVAEAPPTALESAEIPGLTHRVRIF